MKALDDALYAKLAGSLLVADIGNRFYKGRAPDNAVFPYVVHSLVSSVPERTFSEQYENALVQFDLFSSAAGSGEVETIYEHLNALLDEGSLTITGNALIWMRRVNAILMVEEITTPTGAKVWHYAVDYEVMMSLD